MAFIFNIFGNERAVNEEMKKKIVSTLESLHISCGHDCLETMKTSNDFIGICVLHEDGAKKLEDNGHRVKSGYIFVTKSTGLTDRMPGNTLHRKTYNMLFKEIENFKGVTIVGFSQEGKQLKGRSGTFNTDITTNLQHIDSKDCLFLFRTLIFGTVVMYKLSGSRNVSPYSASLCICLFLIIKNQGDPEQLSRFPVSDLDLQDKEVFVKEMLVTLGVHSRIIDVACDYGSYTFITKWLRVQYAMKLLLERLRNDIAESEFKSLLNVLLSVFDGIDAIVRMLKSFFSFH